MFKDIWQYLKPHDTITLCIIVALGVLFVVWLVLLIVSWFRLKGQRDQMEQCSDVEILSKALRSRVTTKDEAANVNTVSLPSDDVSVNTFRSYCANRQIDEDSLVAGHIKAIFDAGWSENRLDVGSLIKYTTNRLFSVNGLLRSLLATFIIIGLLGTLFGLAGSLAQLSPLSPGSSAQTNIELSQGLSDLLKQLKNAFAPSIWGILFTIVGVILFSTYLQLIGSSVKNTLERLTLTVWVPQLFPTTSQRLLETLQLSERQMQRSFKAAEQVAEFAESIENDVGGLKQTIITTNRTLSLLTQSSTQINDFASKFVEGVNGLTPFQQELHTLYQQMVSESKDFQSSVRDNVKNSEEFQKNAREILDHQNKQLKAVLESLQRYEESYKQDRQQIDSAIKEVLVAAKKAYEDIGDRNDEIVEALGVPLRADLSKSFDEVNGTLKVQLQHIVDKFGTFDAPISDAAKKVGGSLQTVVERTETLTAQLQGEFLKQNNTYLEQLKSSDDLNKRIAVLLEDLSKTSQFQGQQAQTLSNTVTDLTQIINSLSQSIMGLSRSVNEGIPSGSTGQNDQRTASSINRLLNFTQDQSHHVQSLISSVNDLRRDVNSLNASVHSSGDNRSADKTGWPPSSDRPVDASINQSNVGFQNEQDQYSGGQSSVSSDANRSGSDLKKGQDKTPVITQSSTSSAPTSPTDQNTGNTSSQGVKSFLNPTDEAKPKGFLGNLRSKLHFRRNK